MLPHIILIHIVICTCRHTHNLCSHKWSTYICEKACLNWKVLSWVLNSDSGDILQTGRQQIPDRRSNKTERVLTKRSQIMFRNFQNFFTWWSEVVAWCMICAEWSWTGFAQSLKVWEKWDMLFKALKVCENWVGSVKVCEFCDLQNTREKLPAYQSKLQFPSPNSFFYF